jgi:RimJ/RimL family protein N-acetyltransferase
VSLSIVPIQPSHLNVLTSLFERISLDPEARYFHPHPFTAAQALARSEYAGRDVYALMLLGSEAVGYGFLRGWEDNYTIPSLGIYIVEDLRGSTAAKVLMEYLHLTAGLRGARSVRLKVHPGNMRARRLYERLGYHFSAEMDDGEFIGTLDLPSATQGFGHEGSPS